ERDDRIRKKFSELVRKSSINHGKSNVPHDIFPVFDVRLPSDADQKVCVWIRDGCNIDENFVRADAREAGNQSPTFTSYSMTLLPGAWVFQGGGNGILGNTIQDVVLDAVANGLQRLFLQFFLADLRYKVKVYEKAQKGALNALQAVGFDDEPAKHPVCKVILGCIAGGKKGADIRSHFESASYGWSRDAVDAGLRVLLVAGLIRAQDEHGQTIPPTEVKYLAINFLRYLGFVSG
ncbi:MAG TPA: BREX system P-loop protein BrxC, partial [Acidobacteriota bacterium]|nr:BREX system P-loop protein BrxC [Acidobacteriota bacterium]